MRGPRSLVAVLVVSLAAVAGPASALLGETQQVGANTFTTTSVHAPTLNSATADLFLCRITLAWTAPASGVAPDGYDVWRSASSGGPYAFVKHVGVVTSTTDTGLSANTTYYYVLRSTKAAWTSSDSNQRSAKTALACV